MSRYTMIRCCLPNDHKHMNIIISLEACLDARFDGFTRYAMMGMWRSNREYGYIYEVSFPADENATLDATSLFRRAARAIGETWCHIERHEFVAMHAKVN